MKGFTLIELIVTVGVVLLIAGGVVANYNNYTDNQRVRQAALTLKNDLRFVQARAFSAEKPTGGCSELVGYVISFTNTNYSIQSQCIEGPVGSIATVNLPTGITFFPIPSSLTFRVLTRGIANDNPVTITLVGRMKQYRLQINPKGDINDLGFQ